MANENNTANENNLKDKVIFITGASRGIGREIALRCAQEGASVIVAAKTAETHETLPGTIHTVAEEVAAVGGKALPIQLDVRDESQIARAVTGAVEYFGGIDILVNNAGAIKLTPTLQTPMKSFDLMFTVNVRAAFACSQVCIPHLKNSNNPHILNLSPPLKLHAHWFKDHLAYSMSKYGMSMCTLGMAEEFRSYGIAVNSLWPRTTIATSAIKVNFPAALYQASRKPTIMAEAAYYIFSSDSKKLTGQFLIDEDVLRTHGITDFDHYAVNPEMTLYPDLFVE